MSNHTPGPWNADWSGDARSRGFVRSKEKAFGAEKGKAVCQICFSSFDFNTIAANASLITAAPDLLEASKEYMEAVNGGLVHFTTKNKLVAAIAKAEGKTP